MQDYEKIIGELIDKQDVCFLSFIDRGGFPTTRAMLNPRKRQGVKEFYLTTNYSSRKAQQLLEHPEAGLYFCDKEHYRGVAFEGMAEVVRDQAVKNEIWRDMDIIFYENNTDPDYCVIKFTAQTARYYQDYQSTDIEL